MTVPALGTQEEKPPRKDGGFRGNGWSQHDALRAIGPPHGYSVVELQASLWRALEPDFCIFGLAA